MKPLLIILFLVSTLSITAQENKRQSQLNGKEQKGILPVFDTSTPYQDYNILLNTFTQNSVKVSLMFCKDSQAYIEYNGKTTETYDFIPFNPLNISLTNVQKDSINSYRVCYKLNGTKDLIKSEWYKFKMPSQNKNSFCFTITSDSHLDENCSSDIYTNIIKLAASENPAFHIDLGDTFMVDKYGNDYRQSYKQYIAQRYYLGIMGEKSPVYLVHGNHDGECLESKDGMAKWAKEQKELFFPSEFDKNYYSVNYDNALIIVLDPYNYSTRQSRREPWQRTLGEEQYHWLERTLKNSSATHKFVFIHNLVGGVDIKGIARGGAEAAKYYEWGGHSQTEKYDFTSRRNGWNSPIHNVLKSYGVSVVFHGHDHIYAEQEYDNIKYICVPQPGFKNRPGRLDNAYEYGYNSGILANNPGFIKVTIVDNEFNIEYIMK